MTQSVYHGSISLNNLHGGAPRWVGSKYDQAAREDQAWAHPEERKVNSKVHVN